MTDLAAAEKALSKAKINLMASNDSVFYSTVCLYLNHRFNPNIPTARTDGMSVEYNPDFLLHWSKDKQTGLMLHEVMHCIFEHIQREGDRCHDKWNRAGDYFINLNIVEETEFNIPDIGLLDTQYRGMSSDEIYELLPDDESMPDGQGDLCPSGSLTEGSDGKPMTPEQVKQEMDDILVHAVTQSTLSGDDPSSIPGGVKRYVDELLNPKVPWQRILRRFMTRMAKNDYTFRKINKRYMPYIMPTRFSEKMAGGAMMLDASGSITQKQYQFALSNTYKILKDLKPEYIDFIQWTTQITKEDRLSNPADFRGVELSESGGTDVNDCMQWLQKNKPAFSIIITDGYFYEPNTVPDCPVIWLVMDNESFQHGWNKPFGKVIHWKEEDI